MADSPEQFQAKIELLTKRRAREFKSDKDLKEMTMMLDKDLRIEFIDYARIPFEQINIKAVYGTIDKQLKIWTAKLVEALKKAA